jgi:hypothetical protein
MGIPLPRKGEFEEVIMVEVLIKEMFGSDRSRSRDYERAVVVGTEVNGANKSTPRSERTRMLTKRKEHTKNQKKGLDRVGIVRDVREADNSFHVDVSF